MNRTQIYLTPHETIGVTKVAVATGRKKSEVIREAIDQYLQRVTPQDGIVKLRAARGIWKDRKDIDLRKIRDEFDRF